MINQGISRLPRINSQPRVRTSNSQYQINVRNQTHEVETGTNTVRATSKTGHFTTIRRTTSSAKISKAFKNQTTGLIYAKKIQNLQMQNNMLNNQIKMVKEQIQHLRRNQMNKKRKQQYIDMEDEKSCISGVTTGQINMKKNINANNPVTLKNQIKVAENKIENYRKKIDKQNDKNNSVKRQIDAFRKQINTIKTLSTQLKEVYQKTNEKYEEQLNLSKKFDELIAEKNNLLHKRKIQSLHEKAKMIKQYDTILKTLDKELQNDKLLGVKDQQDSIIKNCYYVTEANIANRQEKGNSNQLQSPTKKKINYSKEISNVKNQLQNYQDQFKVVQNHTGLINAQEITEDFLSKYEQNFQHYKFIQELYKNLEQLRAEKDQLIQRKKQILKQIENRNTNAKQKQIFQMKVKINGIKNEKQKYKKNIKEYQQIFNKMKNFIRDFFEKINCEKKLPSQFLENLDQSNILVALSIIQERKNQLQSYNSQNQQNVNVLNGNQGDLQQMIDLIKKQGQTMRNDKLYGRQDFLKMRETAASIKKSSGSKYEIKREKSKMSKRKD